MRKAKTYLLMVDCNNDPTTHPVELRRQLDTFLEALGERTTASGNMILCKDTGSAFSIKMRFGEIVRLVE
jgi:hypothetical protein